MYREETYRREEFRRWLESHPNGYSHGTINDYLTYMNRASEIFNVDARLQKLTPKEFREWIKKVDFKQSKKYSQSICAGLNAYVDFYILTQFGKR